MTASGETGAEGPGYGIAGSAAGLEGQEAGPEGQEAGPEGQEAGLEGQEAGLEDREAASEGRELRAVGPGGSIGGPVSEVAPPADGVAASGEGKADFELPADRHGYAGLVTRVVSFAIDAAVINAASVIVAAGAALIVAVLHLPRPVQTLLAAIGGVVYVLWTVGYFVAFWSTTGQTPGARVLRIRVVTADGHRLGPRRALLRCAGVLLAALPLFAGFIRILFDGRRRGFQDRLARTVVIDAPQLSRAETRRARRTGERSLT